CSAPWPLWATTPGRPTIRRCRTAHGFAPWRPPVKSLSRAATPQRGAAINVDAEEKPPKRERGRTERNAGSGGAGRSGGRLPKHQYGVNAEDTFGDGAKTADPRRDCQKKGQVSRPAPNQGSALSGMSYQRTV